MMVFDVVDLETDEIVGEFESEAEAIANTCGGLYPIVSWDPDWVARQSDVPF